MTKKEQYATYLSEKERSGISSIPIMQVRNSSILIYYESLYSPRGLYIGGNRYEVNKEQNYKGIVTKHTRKRIERAVNMLLMSTKEEIKLNPATGKNIKHRLSFMTLTVSENERMLLGKESYTLLLKPFIQWLTKTKGVSKYIWKAELQNRGQIHYHITLPNVIHWEEIRNKWNYLQYKAGLLENYYKTYGHYNPNSTDIHQVYKIKNIEAYLIKYISKSDQNLNSIGGKIWDASINLKGKKYFSTEFNSTNEKNLLRMDNEEKLKEWSNEFCTIIQTKGNKISKVLTPEQRHNLKQHIAQFNSGQ